MSVVSPGAGPKSLEDLVAAVDKLQTSRAHDPVSHPAHYVQGKIETIDVLHDLAERLTRAGLPAAAVYDFTTAVKYLSRAGAKGEALEDAEKAAWYIRSGLHQMAPEKYEDPRADRGRP